MNNIVLQPSTLLDILSRKAQETPGKTAYAHVGEPTQPIERIAYKDLFYEVAAKAKYLFELGTKRGDRVVLLYPSSIDFISSYLACIAAGAIAVPAYPPQRDPDTLSRIVKNCAPRWILCSSAISLKIGTKFAERASFTRKLISLPEVLPHCEPDFPFERCETAMLQYTSGSTGTPKGVILTHHNLLHNLKAIHKHFEITPDDVAFSWMPMYHDMGLIGNVLGSLYCGITLYFMSPALFIQRPSLWLCGIQKFGVTISGGPNFAYQHCVDRVGYDEIRNLNLTNWRIASNGSEPINRSALEGFAEKFSICGFKRKAFLPCYGMAEASLLVSGIAPNALPLVKYLDRQALEEARATSVSRGHPDAVAMVSCGQVIDDHQAVIVDPTTLQALPDSRIGEIWLYGPSIASGYWQTASDKVSPFGAKLSSAPGGPRFLRTGDLGFLCDDHLYVTGRLKDLIIIRGRNYYPQDIEDVSWRSDPALVPNGAIAFQIETEGQGRLVVLQEVKRSRLKTFDPAAIAAAVRSAVATKLQLQVHSVLLIGPQRLPRTSSGKVRRSAARQGYITETIDIIYRSEIGEQPISDPYGTMSAGSVPVGHPTTELERELCIFVARQLRLAPDLIDCRKPVLDLGLDSLSQLDLTFDLKERYGLDISVEQYFDGLTINGIASLVEDVKRVPNHAV